MACWVHFARLAQGILGSIFAHYTVPRSPCLRKLLSIPVLHRFSGHYVICNIVNMYVSIDVRSINARLAVWLYSRLVLAKFLTFVC